MSVQHHVARNGPPREHGTVRAYIIGFVLSLIFTAIPYYLVVNESVSGDALLAVIVGFGFLQMAVQLFFFLHLGRGPKPLYNVGFFLGTFVAILVVVGGSIFIMSHLRYNMTPEDVSKKLVEDEAIYQVGGEKTGACQGKKASHLVTITDGVAYPLRTEARLCDTLTFINEDEKTLEIAFGPHPKHDVYGGETEVSVRNGRSETITLNEPGTYMFHDHLRPSTSGYFIVLE